MKLRKSFGINDKIWSISDCPQGYQLTQGDIPGWGNSIKPGGYLNQNIGQCKDLCNANNLCCSFEWSPTERRCNLNQECVPTEGKYKDYLFCHKPMSKKQHKKGVWWLFIWPPINIHLIQYGYFVGMKSGKLFCINEHEKGSKSIKSLSSLHLPNTISNDHNAGKRAQVCCK